MLTGTVVRYDDTRGYGFITPDEGGEDVFVHANVLGEDKDVFMSGLPVEFEVAESDRGPKALSVRIRRVTSPGGLNEGAGLGTALPAYRPTPPPRPAPRTASAISVAAFQQELTEAVLDAAPTLTGAQITQLRSALIGIAERHGWVEG